MIGIFGKKNRKVLDTSVLIDGRILGIIRTGFWDGEIIVPEFVIQEIHQLIDSGNERKRTKGERGLQILSSIKAIHPIEIHYKQNAEMLAADGVDTKLIFLCKELGAKMLTVDFKLNEIAVIHGIEVLNINELNMAIRPQFLPGDIIDLKITREGRYDGQGIGNLDDGTMVIVKDGLQGLGKVVKASIINFSQSPSGRLYHAQFLR
jgi:uncharacterized protein YacL